MLPLGLNLGSFLVNLEKKEGFNLIQLLGFHHLGLELVFELGCFGVKEGCELGYFLVYF